MKIFQVLGVIPLYLEDFYLSLDNENLFLFLCKKMI